MTQAPHMKNRAGETCIPVPAAKWAAPGYAATPGRKNISHQNLTTGADEPDLDLIWCPCREGSAR